MEILLGSAKEAKEDVELIVTLHGEEFPEIEKDYMYWWMLQITSNRKYPLINELNIDVSFNPEDHAYFHIKEGSPTNEKKEIGNLSVQFTPMSLNFPIKETDIVFTKLSTTKVRWTFKNIDLTKSRFNTIGGNISVRFLPKSAENEKKFKIFFDSYPKFSKKSIFPRIIREKFNLSTNLELINIKSKDIEIKEIIPHDPKFGKPTRDSPDQRILKYTYDTKKGELYKGDVRNVSLRADTLSTLFGYIIEESIKKSKTKDCEDIIRGAGRIIGRDFLFIFENKIHDGKKTKPQQLAYYDSTAGMGKFTIDIRNKFIEVENSFLTYGTSYIQRDITACIFLEGYFEGILRGILDKKNLIVREKKCASRGNSVCRFEVLENGECHGNDNEKGGSVNPAAPPLAIP